QRRLCRRDRLRGRRDHHCVRLLVARAARSTSGSRHYPAARAQLLDRADRRAVYAPRHRRLVVRAGAVPADRLWLVAHDRRPDAGTAGFGDDFDETDDRPPAEALRLSSTPAHQYADRRGVAGDLRAAARRDAGLGGGDAGIRVRAGDVAAIYLDEHAGFRGSAARARRAGFIADLRGAVSRDDVRHRVRIAADGFLPRWPPP